MVMEIGQVDLNSLLNDMTREDEIKTILYNQIKALNFLHSANIMHRDLKPENILLTEHCTVKICDFGLSRSI